MASMKKIGMAALAALTIAGSIAATTTDADARYRRRRFPRRIRRRLSRWRLSWQYYGGYRGGYRGYGIGAGIATGLAIGAIGAGYGYGYGPGYGYYDGCIRNRVVGYTYYGRPIVRAINVCY